MNLKKYPELLPLVEWWEKDGLKTVSTVAVAALCVAGWYGWKHYTASTRAAASAAVANANTTEELEEAVTRFSGTHSEAVLKIRLAKNYYDSGRYEEAIAEYEKLSSKVPAEFAEIPVIGKAQCLEAQKKFAEALSQFESFAAANPKSPFRLTALLGAARCVAQNGDSAKALKAVETLEKEFSSDEIAKARIEAVKSAIERFAKAK